MSGASGSKGRVVDLAADSATFVLRMSTSRSASVRGRRVGSDSSVCVGGGWVVIVVCAWEGTGG